MPVAGSIAGCLTDTGNADAQGILINVIILSRFDVYAMHKKHLTGGVPSL